MVHRNKNNIFLEYKYYVGEIKEKHPKDTFDIDYYLKVSNIGDELTKYGTTNDLKVNINHEEIKYNDMNPILLIKLRIILHIFKFFFVRF